jgi:hypothetical protein
VWGLLVSLVNPKETWSLFAFLHQLRFWARNAFLQAQNWPRWSLNGIQVFYGLSTMPFIIANRFHRFLFRWVLKRCVIAAWLLARI